MRYRRLVSWFYSFALWAQISSAALVALVGGLQRANVEDIARHVPIPAVLHAIGSIHDNAWWELPVVAALSGGLGLLRKHLGSPWLWDAVHFHLDELRTLAFVVEGDDAQHYHRATLFKHVRWLWCRRRWPWSGWLVAVERSGHTTRSGVQYFKAPDAADCAEGIAGRAWSANRIVRVSRLPDVGAADASQEDRETYARKTYISPSQMDGLRQKSRAYCAIPVEVRGILWGVIVLDSRSPDGIKEDTEAFYPHLARLLGKLLEKL